MWGPYRPAPPRSVLCGRAETAARCLRNLQPRVAFVICWCGRRRQTDIALFAAAALRRVVPVTLDVNGLYQRFGLRAIPNVERWMAIESTP